MSSDYLSAYYLSAKYLAAYYPSALYRLPTKENFDPETSERERRKLNRKNYSYSRKKTFYNERGHITNTGKDLCDCLDETCPGCHFPCPKCNSNKCGHECRVNRKWMYDKIEIEGNDFVVKNYYKPK